MGDRGKILKEEKKQVFLSIKHEAELSQVFSENCI
jgi:hypothetical protein